MFEGQDWSIGRRVFEPQAVIQQFDFEEVLNPERSFAFWPRGYGIATAVTRFYGDRIYGARN